jgi:arylsulfatase A-like enzyme
MDATQTGWHLGEYNMWEKRTVWELGTRVPFMVHVPWLPQSHGRHTAGLTELVSAQPRAMIRVCSIRVTIATCALRR